MYSMDLTDKVAVVTGGTKGIGEAVVRVFVDCGAKVVIVGRDYERAEAFSKELGIHRTMAFKADVSIKEDVETLFKETVNKFGKIDILVNNAGISTMDYVIDIKEEDWDKVMDINAKGTFLCSQAAARIMIEKKIGGKIINISSQAGKNGYRCMGNYCSSKHAVLGLTKVMAVEFAKHGINVNAVCPGIVETDMKRQERIWGGELRNTTPEFIEEEDNSQVPLGRTARPEDISNVVLFMASRFSDYMTGQAINVTGGMTMN